MMKKLKGIIISFLLSASMVVGAIGSISAMASGEKIYANIEPYSGSTYMVSIVMEDFTDISVNCFHVELAKGWDLVMDGPDIDYTTEGCTTARDTYHEVRLDNSSFTDGNDIFIAISASRNRNYNGDVIKFKVKKNKYYSASTSAINIRYIAGDYIAHRTADGEERIFGPGYQPTVMLDATQFVVGDADGDGIVNASDASKLLSALDIQSSFNVQSIRHTYKNYFPAALCAAAPDADKSGIINNTDVSRIMNYYSTIATGGTYTGTVGKVDVFERFQ